MNKQQQMQEILKDTVDYYREDPEGRRAVDKNGDCEYTTEDGRHCAIGRYMRPEFLDTEWRENHGVGVHGLSSNVDYYLKHEVRGLDMDFWRDLQDIHDVVGNWCRGSLKTVTHMGRRREVLFTEPSLGLTDIGKERYEGMQDKITRGEYDD